MVERAKVFFSPTLIHAEVPDHLGILCVTLFNRRIISMGALPGCTG